ncbi:MAG: exosortase/archaeosortase family protein [Planctomycetaceae bacterium]
MSDSETATIPWWRRNQTELLVMSGFLPLMFWHIGALLEKPHYQFLFLMPVTLWLLASAADAESSPGSVKQWEAMSCFASLGLSLGGLAFSALVWSPWLAAVCFQFAWGSVLVLRSGWNAARAWLPLWVFCWIIVPLPFGMDEDLIVRLRTFTTRVSSSVLDQIGLLHNSYANVIELPGKPLFIADACSGIHSLYVLMGAALFLCCWSKRGITHSVILLISTFGIVLIENVVRIVAVAVAWGRGMDWSEGFNHELLGIVLFVLSLGLIFTTDQLLLFVFPPNAPSLRQRLAVWTRSRNDDSYYDTSDRKKKRQAAAAGPKLLQMTRMLAWIFPEYADCSR